MIRSRALAIACVAVALSAQPFAAGELSRYRAYGLDSSVAAVVLLSGTRESDLKTLHARPARIQTLEWRAPYVATGQVAADPVRDLQFSFVDDRLFQVVVTYDRDRVEGLTNDDIVGSLSATYGTPLPPAGRGGRMTGPATVPQDAAVVARWEDATALLTLTRSTYSKQFQVVLVSKALNAKALAAIKEALRLDTQEAPQRELDLRKRETATADAANEKARGVNKAAFKP